MLWQFGDGATSTSTDPVTTHHYATSGPRTVTLTVTDDDGVSRSTTVNINPQAPAGNAPPTASPTVTCQLLVCNFTANAGDTDGNITGYLWDFGDTETSTEQNPQHTFGSPGAKHVPPYLGRDADEIVSGHPRGQPAGFAVSANFYPGARVERVTARLLDGGKPVECYLSTPAKPLPQTGTYRQILLIPKKALTAKKPKSRYLAGHGAEEAVLLARTATDAIKDRAIVREAHMPAPE